MAILSSPAVRVENTYSLPIKSDRFAPTNERSQRTQPLMRKFEIVSLLPCGSARTSHHLAPATDLFEATSSAFARGTLISTPMGPTAIEDLYPGDLIDTIDGNPEPVVWIGSTSYGPSQSLPNSSLNGLIRILSDGYSNSGSFGDLMLGPSARLLQSRPSLEQIIGVKSVLTPARDLEDGHSAFVVTPPSSVRLFHVCLQRHTAIYAGGRPVETYHPGKGIEDALGDNMRSLFLSLFPQIERFEDFGSLAFPRMSKDTLESLTRS
ncbi:Hint domain-containing protein [Planktotalea sp.]|uniref:Hint domain-containing protein n=1 Tax=Planktotalea sp. TaxID=2029877 RepID=UPI003D6B1144